MISSCRESFYWSSDNIYVLSQRTRQQRFTKPSRVLSPSPRSVIAFTGEYHRYVTAPDQVNIVPTLETHADELTFVTGPKSEYLLPTRHYADDDNDRTHLLIYWWHAPDRYHMMMREAHGRHTLCYSRCHFSRRLEYSNFPPRVIAEVISLEPRRDIARSRVGTTASPILTRHYHL
jgi:hypothetical protein